MQKSMDRPATECLKTLADVGKYIHQGRSHARWEDLLALWWVTKLPLNQSFSNKLNKSLSNTEYEYFYIL